MNRPPARAPAGHPHPATLLPHTAPDCRPPDADDLRAVKELLGKTDEEIAALVGVKARTVRRWLAKPPARTRSPIQYTPWRLLLVAAKLIKPGQL